MQTTNAQIEPKRAGAIALKTTRILSAIVAALILVQGALAGSFLSGAGGALDAHRAIALQVLALLGIAVVVTAAFAARRNVWIVPASIVGFLGIGSQIAVGFAGQLNIHVPLGIALFGIYLTMALVLKDRKTAKGNSA